MRTKFADVAQHADAFFVICAISITYRNQRRDRATSKVVPLPLLAPKSSVATATRNSSSKVARYRYFTAKVAALPVTLNNF